MELGGAAGRAHPGPRQLDTLQPLYSRSGVWALGRFINCYVIP